MIARSISLFVLAAACFLPTLLLASPESEVRSKTVFKDFALSDVEDGKVLDNRSPLPGSPEIVVVQTCFILKAPPSRVASLLLAWNPAGKSGLEVSSHRALAPGADASAFHEPMETFLKSSGGAWMVAQSKKATDPSCELLLTAPEKEKLAKAHEDALASVWSSILAGRFASFREHGATGFSSLMSAVKKATSLDVGAPSGDRFYWELSDVDRRGSISEATSWQDSSGPTRVFDGEFFVTSEYAASFNASTLWPVTVKGKEATLVWRIDSALSDQFSDLHGAERLASSGMVLSSVKRTIEAFRQQLEK